MYKIAVLTSGMSRGSNLEALARYFSENKLPVEIAFALKTRNSAPMTQICERYDVPCIFLPYQNQVQFETELLKYISIYRLNLIALAGFLKLLSRDFTQRVNIPILNIHPALLPKYGGKGMYGKAVHSAIFAAGDMISGVTIHKVDALYDHGEIIAQERVDISTCRSAEEIAAKVLKLEHQLYAKTIWQYLNR